MSAAFKFEGLEAYTFYQDILFFPLSLSAIIYTLVLRKFKLEKTAIFTLFVYMMAFLLRFIQEFINPDSLKFETGNLGLTLASRLMISLVLYHYILEMKNVRIKIEVSLISINKSK